MGALANVNEGSIPRVLERVGEGRCHQAFWSPSAGWGRHGHRLWICEWQMHKRGTIDGKPLQAPALDAAIGQDGKTLDFGQALTEAASSEPYPSAAG
jgi:hypothetical protein